MDDALRVRWNPKTVMSTMPKWDTEGRLIPAKYEGRWEVGKFQNGEWKVIWTVVNPEDSESYMPVGGWLVEFFRKWDSQQAHFRGEMEKARREHDEAEARSAVWQDEAAAREALERKYSQLHPGGQYIGRGF